ncbi:MAG: hypothetical protein JW892_06010 [Anaerolineae bacterium]|nr:hypothetical protein [Anaerolineae bacterium]
MTRWILTAEADKIQHLVFRSSKLRDVVGGSQLLTDFCADATRTIPDQDRIVADGGSFTLLFDTEDDAVAFGRQLAQQYYIKTGSTLTVAKPTPWSGKDPDFQAANKAARQALAQAKREGRPAAGIAQGPHMAFCASCGVGLAETHRVLVEGETAQYVCPVCQAKAQKRSEKHHRFLLDLEQAVVGDRFREFDSPTTPDELAKGWDAHQYVAYLVADGNSMGRVFGKCSTPGALRDLSKGLKDVVLASLAAPTRTLLGRAPFDADQHLIPVLPLILGGDDVFVLLPAAYALDFAREFCLQYEQQMAARLQELGLTGLHPTMSAAVVICKSAYPHTLVHKRGEALLKQAKRLSKAVAQRDGPNHQHSIVNFEVILGSRLSHDFGADAKYRNTLAPYWVVAPTATVPEHRGLSLEVLLQQRLTLAGRPIPQRRLMQLRALFEPKALPDDTVRTSGAWNAALGRLQARVSRNANDLEILEGVLKALGGASDDWYYCDRPGPGSEEVFSGHGLPDLIRVWDFSWKLDQDRSVYAARED